MEKSYTFKYRLEDLALTPSKQTVDVLYYQNELFRHRLDFLRKFRKKFFFHILLSQIVLNMILLVLSTLIIMIGLFMDEKIEWIGVFGICVAILSLLVASLQVFLETLRGRGYRKAIISKLIRFRYKMLKFGLKRHLPYEMKYEFDNDNINIQVLNKRYDKNISIKKFQKIIKIEDAFLFFKRNFSPNYSFAVRFENKTHEKIIENFLNSNKKEWINYEDIF